MHPPEIAAATIPVQPAEQQARDAYKALIAAGPDNPLSNDVRLELAELFARRDEHPAAVAASDAGSRPRAVVGIDRSDSSASRFVSPVSKGFSRALAQFDAVAQNPKSPAAPEARYRAGECLMAQEDWPKAIARLLPFRDDGALHQVPGISDRAVLRLGHAYARPRSGTRAGSRWKRSSAAIRKVPGSTKPRYGIAWAWQNQKQFDQAVNVYVQVVGRTATEVAARVQFQIGLCRLEQKRPAEAANALLVVPFTYDYPEWTALAPVRSLTGVRGHAAVGPGGKVARARPEGPPGEPCGRGGEEAAGGAEMTKSQFRMSKENQKTNSKWR